MRENTEEHVAGQAAYDHMGSQYGGYTRMVRLTREREKKVGSAAAQMPPRLGWGATGPDVTQQP
jgi:hypothetical protein